MNSRCITVAWWSTMDTNRCVCLETLAKQITSCRPSPTPTGPNVRPGGYTSLYVTSVQCICIKSLLLSTTNPTAFLVTWIAVSRSHTRAHSHSHTRCPFTHTQSVKSPSAECVCAQQTYFFFSCVCGAASGQQ